LRPFPAPHSTVDSRSNSIVLGKNSGNGSYDFPTVKYDSSVSGGIAGPRPELPIAGLRFSIAPNPVANGCATLRFAGATFQPRLGERSQETSLTVRIFDTGGREVLARSVPHALPAAHY
jgi:hypothetical protein